MDDTAKYLIHATITADGVVERSDVVGAIFGQTEGLLGDELDLRDLQQSSKVGRIDVQVRSENGQSFGNVTIASSLDKVETAILAASLETISRVGPCQAAIEVTDIEDVRAAKRREVVDRAKELLADSFSESVMTSDEILEEVREAVRVEDITEFEGLPAGPRVADSDAIIVVEGRADVLRLLRYGIKNAIAVEGTNVPEAVADLTLGRTVTAFLDGDRGGELILRELAQVGEIDYVAFAPADRSVEELGRAEVLSALREKVPYDSLADAGDVQGAVAATDGSSRPAPEDATYPRTESPETTDAPTAPDPEEQDADDDPAEDDRGSTDLDAGTDDPTATEGDGNTAATDASDTSDTSDVTDASDSTVESVESVDSINSVNSVDPSTPTDTADDTGATDADAGAADAPEATGGETDAPEADAASEDPTAEPTDDREPVTLRGHVREVIGSDTGRVRLLDDEFASLSETDAGNAFAAVESADVAPYAVVVDGELPQRVLDVAAQRGVAQLVARSTGEFVKQPVTPRVRTAAQLDVE